MISTKTKKNVEANEGYNKELLMEIERLKKELEDAKNATTVVQAPAGSEAEMMDGRIAGMVQSLDQNLS